MTDTGKQNRPRVLTEAEIQAVTLGPRTLHNAPITLAPYDPGWPQTYLSIAAAIQTALGEHSLSVEHVGSTAVPGLSAKPIIDVLLVVPDSSVEEDYVPALETAGFRLHIREPDWHQHRLLKCGWAETHVHVFSSGCAEIRRMCLFRDRLRSNADERHLYEQVKTELARQTWQYVQNYADAKAGVVEQILSRAMNQ